MAKNTITREQYAKQAREKAIKESMSYGNSREQSEKAFDYVTKYYKKKYAEIDEYSAIIRNANESLYGCGMLDRILTTDDLVKLGKIEPHKSQKHKPVTQRSTKSRSMNVANKSRSTTGANVQSHKAAPKAATTYTVKDGRKSKTFATKGEAETCASQAKNRNVTITKGTKQPTHRIVNFTAKK